MHPNPRPNHFHLLNAGGQLPPDLAPPIEEVGRAAFLRLADRLGLDGVDAALYVSPWTIPETGLVGNAPDGFSVHVAVTPGSPHFRAGWRRELPATLAHELHHARRWRHAGPTAEFRGLERIRSRPLNRAKRATENGSGWKWSPGA